MLCPGAKPVKWSGSTIIATTGSVFTRLPKNCSTPTTGGQSSPLVIFQYNGVPVSTPFEATFGQSRLTDAAIATAEYWELW